MTTLEEASKLNRLALKRTCGALASGTRVALVSEEGGLYNVEKQIYVVTHSQEGKELSRMKRWHHELVTADDLVILRNKVS